MIGSHLFLLGMDRYRGSSPHSLSGVLLTLCLEVRISLTGVGQSVGQPVSRSVGQSVCLSVCLSVCQSVSQSVCLSNVALAGALLIL